MAQSDGQIAESIPKELDLSLVREEDEETEAEERLESSGGLKVWVVM